MAEELKIVLEVEGANKVTTALDNTSEALKNTADEAKKAGTALNNNLAKGTGQANTAITNLNRVVQDVPFGFIGISNNLGPLVDSFTALKQSTGSSGQAFKTLLSSLTGPAGIGLAFAAITTAISFAQIGFRNWIKTAEEAKQKADETAKSLNNVIAPLSKEKTEIDEIIYLLNNETLSRKQRNEAIKELQKLSPEYFANLNNEKATIDQINLAYEKYASNITNVITAELKRKEIEKLQQRLLELQDKSAKAGEREIYINGKLTKVTNAVYADNQKQLSFRERQQRMIEGTVGLLDDEVNEYRNLSLQIKGLISELGKLEGGKKFDKVIAPEKIKKAKKELESFDTVLIKTLQGLRDQEQISIAIDNSTIDEQIKIVKDTINKAIKDYNLPSNDQRVIVLSAILDELEATKAVEDGANNIKKNIENKKQFRIKQKIIPEIQTEGIDVKKLEKELTSILNQTFINIGKSIGETLGNALTGAAKLGDVFKGIFNALANGVKAMGEKMIELGVLALMLKVSLSQIFENPGLAIAVGIGLVALGQALNNLTTSKFAVGTRFAPGGMALVGERGPEMVSLPRGSQVLPAAQTSAMLGGKNQVEVVGVLRGQDIYFSNKKYSQSYNRQT